MSCILFHVYVSAQRYCYYYKLVIGIFKHLGSLSLFIILHRNKKSCEEESEEANVQCSSDCWRKDTIVTIRSTDQSRAEPSPYLAMFMKTRSRSRQGGYRFLGSLKGLQLRAQVRFTLFSTYEVKYGVRSPKFIWAPLYSCTHWPSPSIWAHVRGRYWWKMHKFWWHATEILIAMWKMRKFWCCAAEILVLLLKGSEWVTRSSLSHKTTSQMAKSHSCPGFDLNNLLHSGIRRAADEAVFNKYLNFQKNSSFYLFR